MQNQVFVVVVVAMVAVVTVDVSLGATDVVVSLYGTELDQ